MKDSQSVSQTVRDKTKNEWMHKIKWDTVNHHKCIRRIFKQPGRQAANQPSDGSRRPAKPKFWILSLIFSSTLNTFGSQCFFHSPIFFVYLFIHFRFSSLVHFLAFVQCQVKQIDGTAAAAAVASIVYAIHTDFLFSGALKSQCGEANTEQWTLNNINWKNSTDNNNYFNFYFCLVIITETFISFSFLFVVLKVHCIHLLLVFWNMLSSGGGGGEDGDGGRGRVFRACTS